MGKIGGMDSPDVHPLRRFWNDATARTPLELVSPLKRDEVERRLKDAIDTEWIIFGGKPVIGRVDNGTFRLRCRINYRNSFQTVLFGTLVEEGRGTRLRGRTGTHPFVALFMAVWLGVIGLGVATTVAVMPSLPDREAAVAVAGVSFFVPFVLVAFGVALVWLGRRFARGERERLIGFLRQTVEARDS